MTLKEFKIQYALGSLSNNDLIKLAENPDTLISILKKLAKLAFSGNRREYNYPNLINWKIRCGLAKNLNTPIKILKELSNEHSWAIKTNLQNNPTKILTANQAYGR